MDQFDVDRRALGWAKGVVGEVRPEHLDARTPCGEWSLRQLLGHMTAHNHGFAAAIGGTPVGGEVWDSLEVDESDVSGAFAASADRLTGVLTGGIPDRIEVYGYGTFGIGTVLGMHIVDFVVHGWDVARSIGLDRMPDEDLAAAAYEIMRRFPTDRPSPAFGVMVPIADDAPVADRLMAYVGRDPHWTN